MKQPKTSKRSKTKVQVRDLKPVKNAKGGGKSPLFQACATGKHFNKATLTV